MRPAVRSAIKAVAFRVFGSPPMIAAKLRAIRAAGAVTILNLHRVGPPDGSTYPPLAPHLFDDLLRFVRRHFDVVTFADLGRKPANGQPRLILSFDDGYADFATHAAPLLERHGVRANINIIPECVESGLPPLNITVQDFAGKAPVAALQSLRVPGFDEDPAALGREAFGRRLGMYVATRTNAVQRELAEAILPQVRQVEGFAPTPMLDLDQVKAIAARHELGAHSYAHASMALETDDYLRCDIDACRHWFARNLDRAVDVYAFPNGSHREGQAALVHGAGIAHVLLVEGRFSTECAKAHPRFNMDARSTAELRFRATGGLCWPGSQP